MKLKLCILIILTTFMLIGCSSNAKVCINSNCFNSEIADTPEKQQLGLMNRESLDADKGMLFIFDKEVIHSFWMKNTLIPLDMIWINSNNEIVYIKKYAQPCEAMPCESFNPGKISKYVLEVYGGTVDKKGINVGDKVTIKI